MMKKVIALILAAALAIPLAGCAQAEKSVSADSVLTLSDTSQHYGTTFGQGKVIEVNIKISESDWKDVLDNASDEAYHSADVTVNGTTVSNVGFRTKGLSSLMSVSKSDSDRYGFKVKLDEYVKGQNLNGLSMFVLNGSFADPSYMREYLTYAAMAELDGITPYVSYVNLSVNGTLFGFYTMVESYNDSFVERYSSASDTVLYKANTENCTLLPSDDGSGFDVDYGKDDDKTNIKKLVAVLNSTTEANKSDLEGILDVDSALKAFALNTVTGNYDSYSGSKAHNYYLMFSGGKFSYIGWDYNMSMGGFPEDNGGSVSADVNTGVYNVQLSQRPLIEKLLAVSEYKQRYLEYVQKLEDYFSNIKAKASAIATVIRSDVKADPSAFYTIDQFENNIKDTGTDLSQSSGKQNGGGNFGGQGGNGNWTGSRPNGMQGGTTTDGMPGGTPSGGQMTPPSGWTGSRPDNWTGSRPDWGNMPGGPGGNNGTDSMPTVSGGQNGFPGGGISEESVSIVDYLTQRIEKIKG